MSIFTLDKGDFVRRSPGSDEFRIFSTSKTPQEIKRLLSNLYANRNLNSLLTWDFGYGRNREPRRRTNFKNNEKTSDPWLLRQTILESHSEIPRRIEENNTHQSWNEFNMPYERLIDTICSLGLPATVEQQIIEQVRVTKSIVENIVTRDPLTSTLNGLGAKWYLDNQRFKAWR